MPINIDIDVKVEKIHVYPLPNGMKATFELRDANNLETNLYLTFYKKQVDYIMEQFYKVDKEKIRAELALDFVKKEKQMRSQFQLEYNSLNQEYEALLEEFKPKEESDAKATD